MQFFETQQKFIAAVFSGVYNYLLFGGAIRGGKSYVSIGLILALCKIFPGSRWAIVRKDLPTLRRTTVPTFLKIVAAACPSFCSPINKSDWTVRCANGSEIVFFPESLKTDSDLDRWKGLEVNGFAIEEANECSADSFTKAMERAGSWTADCETQPPPLVILTCNPARNWVYKTFYQPWAAGELEAPYFYLPSCITDNPHLTAAYLAGLEQMKKHDEAAYNRFVLGDWEQDDDPTQLIGYEWCLATLTAEDRPGNARLGVDVGRFGPDPTALAHMAGNRLHRLESHPKTAVTMTADIVELRMDAGHISPARVAIDIVGLGAGVLDILVGKGYAVQGVVGGARPIEREDSDDEGDDETDGKQGVSSYKFFNLRSQLWWELREMIRQGLLFIDLPPGKKRDQLFEDLTAPRYSISGDKVIRIESKDDTKARLGRSPDLGDALVYAVADLGEPEPEWVIA